MSFEEAEVLRERAEGFLRNAEDLYEKGVYDLAAFSLEQHCQLMLKYKLLLRTDAYPRTHSLIGLVRELSHLSPNLYSLLENDENLLNLTRIEDFYISARYLPRRFERVEVESTLRFVKEVFKPIVDGV
ncbi:DNA-binding protein [Candidatus Bathyarchaeota archaeon RBG_13_52_12]|nr:MAG: DNA-binding protein [Candidatus Bathyarchaeota archaeon RBG_13_52_12]